MNKLTLIALLAGIAGVVVGRYASLPLAAVALGALLIGGVLYSRLYAEPKKRLNARIAQVLLDKHLVDRKAVQRLRQVTA